jgi:quercetin dioxygenase-like cupin family protein
MSFFSVAELPATHMLPGVVRRAVYLDHAMVTFFDFEPGAVIPEHDHPHEQITFVVQGRMDFTLDGETRSLEGGDGVCIPPHVPHSAVVGDEPAFVIDAWYPAREDYR